VSWLPFRSKVRVIDISRERLLNLVDHRFEPLPPQRLRDF
jgi:hypothetical protein